MSLRSSWRMEREGFTIDTIVRILRNTAFNPVATVPLYLACLYQCKGREAAIKSSTAITWLEKLVVLGMLRKVNAFLNKGVLNNWVGDTYDWKKEVVVITGGSDGIGARVVQMLAERGITVAVLDIQPPRFEATSAVHYFQCDVVSQASIHAAAAAVRSKIGNPTILINNAGIVRGKTILETTKSDLDMTFDINGKCMYLLAQEFLPYMIEHDHGMVLTIASMAAQVTAPRMASYAASKAAALSFHEGLQVELATIYKAPRVRSVVVCPTFVKTDLFTGFDKGDGFTAYGLEVDTVAEAIVNAVLSGRTNYIVLPLSLSVAYGIRNWPWWFQTIIRKDLVKVMQNFRGRSVPQPSELEITGVMDSDLLDEKQYVVVD